MKLAFYPGCVAKGGAPELYMSVTAVAPILGLELSELTEAACSGAGVLSERNPELADTINARTFAMAERQGLPLMTICSTCQGTMGQANQRLKGDADYRGRINGALSDEGYQYGGTTDIKHLLWILVEDVGLDKVRQAVRRPLTGLAVAPFYGCYLLRPSTVLGYHENPDRGRYLEEVITALGAEPVRDYEGRDRCCGFPLLTMNRRGSLGLTGSRISEAQDAGADCIVTPCPLCHLNLDGQQRAAAEVAQRPLGLPVLHLPQLLGLAFGLAPEQLGLERHFQSTRPVLAKLAAAVAH